jgi:hypothetical protein
MSKLSIFSSLSDWKELPQKSAFVSIYGQELSIKKPVLWIRIRLDLLAFFWPTYIKICLGNADPDLGAWKFTKI